EDEPERSLEPARLAAIDRREGVPGDEEPRVGDVGRRPAEDACLLDVARPLAESEYGADTDGVRGGVVAEVGGVEALSLGLRGEVAHPGRRVGLRSERHVRDACELVPPREQAADAISSPGEEARVE